ncbi:Toll/interleukin-1 receptor homology (TIR) domain [Arabidopsis thaliana x Arabidopsis arenosa]|uniref:Toll/interleukin-1 receptor homology (TIR) domain n=1 Tax=Arabidopsis thaliana x Arabidopsis arenosa TaxID=1240361 RepID=A0A8T1Z1T0_9BRAS|nr:Toll/interleukin-1 receptor homology (TIR) domain [Arabidopsis thaliana x Arabidopsis arenosa]
MDQEKILAMKGIAPPQHQVFVSFRGSDVRHNFFSFLKDALIKNGINVVTDEEAPRGKPIDENLLKLIRNSRIAVVIFSENYPESTWCLDELVEIEKQMDIKILDSCPIFFEVETSHVKLQAPRSNFDYNLLRLEHEERKKARQISKKAWEDAEESNQATFVNGIVEKVKDMLDSVPSSYTVPKHQVYISFRGQDIRKKFSSFLKAALQKSGINVFIDAEDVNGGGALKSLLIDIGRSRVALVIFTENYMSSSWCLEELVEIKKLKDMGMLLVIPIFYEVNPSDMVDDQQLVAKWGSTDGRIKKWKEALVSVANITGFISSKHKSEADLVEDILQGTKKILFSISST